MIKTVRSQISGTVSVEQAKQIAEILGLDSDTTEKIEITSGQYIASVFEVEHWSDELVSALEELSK